MGEQCMQSLAGGDAVADSWQANMHSHAENDNEAKQTVSDYVAGILKPLQTFLLFLNDHSLEHIEIKQKNCLIWNVLNGICKEYWHKIKAVQDRTAQIRKIMERRRKRQSDEEKSSNANGNRMGAERVEYQLFLDVRLFMQQIQGYIGGLQRDQKVLEAKMEKEAMEKRKSSIIVSIKKKKNTPTEMIYCTDNLEN